MIHQKVLQFIRGSYTSNLYSRYSHIISTHSTRRAFHSLKGSNVIRSRILQWGIKNLPRKGRRRVKRVFYVCPKHEGIIRRMTRIFGRTWEIINETSLKCTHTHTSWREGSQKGTHTNVCENKSLIVMNYAVTIAHVFEQIPLLVQFLISTCPRGRKEREAKKMLAVFTSPTMM